MILKKYINFITEAVFYRDSKDDGIDAKDHKERAKFKYFTTGTREKLKYYCNDNIRDTQEEISQEEYELARDGKKKEDITSQIKYTVVGSDGCLYGLNPEYNDKVKSTFNLKLRFKTNPEMFIKLKKDDSKEKEEELKRQQEEAKKKEEELKRQQEEAKKKEEDDEDDLFSFLDELLKDEGADKSQTITPKEEPKKEPERNLYIDPKKNILNKKIEIIKTVDDANNYLQQLTKLKYINLDGTKDIIVLKKICYAVTDVYQKYPKLFDFKDFYFGLDLSVNMYEKNIREMYRSMFSSWGAVHPDYKKELKKNSKKLFNSFLEQNVLVALGQIQSKYCSTVYDFFPVVRIDNIDTNCSLNELLNKIEEKYPGSKKSELKDLYNRYIDILAESNRKNYENILRLISKDNVKSLSLRRTGGVTGLSVDGKAIILNSNYFSNDDEWLQKTYSFNQEGIPYGMNNHPNGTTYITTIYHEFGHIISNMLKLTQFYELYGEFGTQNSTIKELFKEAKKISTYAQTNIEEFIAECFAECMESSKPSEIAIKVVNEIDKQYKGL